MEFEKKAKITEKSWNFKISIWKNHGKKFSALRTFHPILAHCLDYCNCYKLSWVFYVAIRICKETTLKTQLCVL